MPMNTENLDVLFNSQIFKIVLIGTMVVLVLLFLFFRLRKASLHKKMKAFEQRYNTIKGIPLPFKMNKAAALAKVRDDVFVIVNDLKNEFDTIQDGFKALAYQLGESEDAILTNKFKLAQKNFKQITLNLAILEQQCQTLDQKLEEVLQEENQQRGEITELKEAFRNAKNAMLSHGPRLSISNEVLSDKVKLIESNFSLFEEWMIASEFSKAKDKSDEILKSIKELAYLVNDLPELITLAIGVIPKQMEEITALLRNVKAKGIYVAHLDVMKNLNLIAEVTKEDVKDLTLCNMANVSNHLIENQKRLSQLLLQLQKEDGSFEELKTIFISLKDNLKTAYDLYKSVESMSKKESNRLGLKDYVSLLTQSDQQLTTIKENIDQLIKLKDEKSLPASTLLSNVKETAQDLSMRVSILQDAYNMLNTAKNDEERAKKQLLKLHLIMNEVQVKTRIYNLPSISLPYEGDIQKSYEYILAINDYLKSVPIDINQLNKTVNDAIDVVYRLYNNVNNLIGTVEMIENAIVYGNKYRLFHSELDTQLTRAELLFRNGDYTQAINTAIAAIEMVQPSTYDKLIKENSKSADN